MKKQTGSVEGYRLSVFGHRWGLSTVHCLLFTLALLAGTAWGQTTRTNDWTGSGANMNAAANWSLGVVPSSTDIARWNLPSYVNQPTNTALSLGQLLFDAGNTGGTMLGGSGTLTLSRLDGVSIQINNGSGAVTNAAPVSAPYGLRLVNNLASLGPALTLTNITLATGGLGLIVSGTGDTTINGVFNRGGTYSMLFMNGTGVLTLGGNTDNSDTSFGPTYVNSGKLLLAKTGSARAMLVTAGQPGPIEVGQRNGTAALVQYTGDSTDMIGGIYAAPYLFGVGQLDFNGKTDAVGLLNINSTGAGRDTCALTNSTPGSGNFGVGMWDMLSITPEPGYTTTLDTGTPGTGGLLSLSNNLSFINAGDGRARIAGNLNLGLATRSIYVSDGEALNDMVIDAVISGGSATVGFTKALYVGTYGNGRLILGGSNTFSGPVTVSAGILTITNSSALGTSGGAAAVDGTTVLSTFGNPPWIAATLELPGGISVNGEWLAVTGTGQYMYGGLRNVSGDNSWNGPITVNPTAGNISTRIFSDSGTLTLGGIITNSAPAGYSFEFGGLGNVKFTNTIASTTAGQLYSKLGAGTVTLAGANTFSGNTTLRGGTLVLDYASQDNSKLPDSGTLTLTRGTLTLSGGTHIETNAATSVGQIVPTVDGGYVRITRNGGSTAVLRMNAITWGSAGSALDFAEDNLADTDTTNTYGILGGWATVGSNTWAYNTTGAADGPIAGLPGSGYTTNSATSLGSADSNLDVRVNFAGNAVARINSIRFDTPTARSFNITNNANIDLYGKGGGILVTPNMGAGDIVMTNGTIVPRGLNTCTLIHQYNTNGTLYLYTQLAAYGLTKVGPGKAVLGGSSHGIGSSGGLLYVWDGELDLETSTGPAVAALSPAYIGQNGRIKLTGASANQIVDTCALTITEGGQFDLNGKTEKIANVTITSTGASGDTCPLTNSTPTSGNLIMGTLTVTPMSGCRTLIDSGSGGTNTLTGDLLVYAAGNGTLQISGNLVLTNGTRTFTIYSGEALIDVVIDAKISGSGWTFGQAGGQRLLLGGANTYTGLTTISAGSSRFLRITNSAALGATGPGNGTVISGYNEDTNGDQSLELAGGVAVGTEPLQLAGKGGLQESVWVGALRNVSGDNSWGGPVTLTNGSGGVTKKNVWINSDSGTLTISSGDNFALGDYFLQVGGRGNVTINDVITGGAGTLTKVDLGTLELGGGSANTYTGLTTVSRGTLVLNKTAGRAIEGPLTITGDRLNSGIVQYKTGTVNTDLIGANTVTINASGVLDLNGATDTLGNLVINTVGNYFDPMPIRNTAGNGQLTVGSLTIDGAGYFITTLDFGTGTLGLGGALTFNNTGTARQGRLLGNIDLTGGTQTFNVTASGTAPPIYDLDIAAIVGNGALTKAGAGILRLSGVNTYAGPTTVSAGTLMVGGVTPVGSIAQSSVSVSPGATLQLEHSQALGASKELALNSSAGTYGKANLNFVGTQTVAVLRFDGVAQGGTWGSTSSTAANKTNTWFSGTGVVLVNGPQIQNEAVASVSDTGATFNGWLVSGGPATVGVLWGTTDGSVSGAWANTNWFDGTVSDNTHLSTNIASLTTGIPYYYTFVASNASAVVRAAPSVSFVPSSGTTKTWLTTGTTDLMASGNWSPAGVPDATCNLIINTAGGKQPLLNLTSGSVTIKSLSIGATAATALTFTNGNVDTKILNVTGDVTIGPNGILTHAAETASGSTVGDEVNRLRLNVGGNLTIAAGGQINVDYKGYAAQKGPGAGVDSYTSSSHGGIGGRVNDGTRAIGLTYGSVTNPVNAGSGSAGVSGGGVVVLTVGGTLAVNGSISAKGQDQGSNNGGGAGGSINIVAGNLTIAGTSLISATGGDALPTQGYDGGGGGRIAIVLTNASDAAFASWVASTNIVACGGLGRADKEHGAAGTVYLKGTNNTYGTLVVNNLGRGANFFNNGGAPAKATTLVRNSTLLFDSIICTNYGVLAISSNSVLDLSQGCVLRSDSTTNSITSRLIIGIGGTTRVYGGLAGSVTWPASYTNTGTISVGGTNTVTLGSNFTIGSGGILTHEAITSTLSNPEDHKLIASVSGGLTINAGGAIYVNSRGYILNQGPGRSTGASFGSAGHGGLGGLQSAQSPQNAPNATYGSITNPVTAGSGSGGAYGGGAVVLAVGGTLTVNGVVRADGGDNFGNAGGASGGSVNIVAATLAGAGTVSAVGGNANNSQGKAGGGGGRIAMVVTNDSSAVFAPFLTSTNIAAYGGLKGAGNTEHGAAGTVYLKGINQPYGRLIVDNIGRDCIVVRTEINPNVLDKTVGDVVLQNAGRMTLTNATLTVYGSWSNAVATNAISGGTVEFAGAAPATIWGGNTWSNLTIIASADKTVNFEAGKTQFVYGVAAFTNVTLQSTVLNTQWHLRKPGIGTQYVGRVTVYDSHAGTNTTHNMFWGAVGSVVSDPQNVNWDAFKAKGTVLLFR